MNNIIIKYTNGTSYSQNVKNEEVGKKYADAVISIARHHDHLDDIEYIEMTNQNAYKHLLYQKGQSDARTIIVRHDPLSGDVPNNHNPILESERT